MSLNIITPFLPSVHGFRFPNTFRNPVGPLISTWGRCNGMSQIALDYFHAGRTIPDIVDVNYDRPLESGIGAAIGTDGSTQLFAVRMGDPHDIVGRTLHGANHGYWGSCVNGRTAITPATVCWGPDRTDLVMVGEDAQLYIASRDGTPLAEVRRDCSGNLPGFSALGGRTAVQPAITSPTPGQLQVYMVDATSRALCVRHYDGGWSDWTSLGGEATSGCAAIAHAGDASAFVRGNDHQMWVCDMVGSAPARWRPLGGVFTSGPAVASPGPGRVELYGRGLDGGIWQNIRNGDDWTGWASIGMPPGGTREEAPAAVAAIGLMNVFARASDGAVWQTRWENGDWQAWTQVDAITETSKRLTEAIFGRTMSSTVSPLIAASAALGIPLPFITVGRYLTWRTCTDDQTFHWSATEELPKLFRTLSAGTPIPLGLLSHDGWGHEVVAYGLESDSDLPPGSFEFPGDLTFHIRVYDPNHPGCDDNRISFSGRDLRRTIDREHPAIFSSTGEQWRGCFIRDDYRAETPPV